MKTIVESVSPGSAAFIPHQRQVLMKEDGYEVVAITGEAPDAENGGDGNEEDEEDGRANIGDLGTRFNLLHDNVEVARCYMSYRDASYDPSTGPTVEMIAVHQHHRGKGLAKVLWYWVLRFIETNFALECLNNDAPRGQIMIKATQIGTEEVEKRKRKRDGEVVPVGFKEFVFDFCGFSVRVQKGLMAHMFNSRRPMDEEAVLYIPCLSKKELAAKLATDAKKAPKPGNAVLRAKCGARMCLWCRNVAQDLLRCNRCEVSFYCNRECQKKDWKRHKKWCSKTREEVKNRLIEEGGMMKLPDGSYSLNMSFGNMGF
uniref:MYND-type domain-containing protein n=1 Tax=Helicotheca tamesis TaxID=374047 RepID=A0A7S2GQV3_9STRA